MAHATVGVTAPLPGVGTLKGYGAPADPEEGEAAEEGAGLEPLPSAMPPLGEALDLLPPGTALPPGAAGVDAATVAAPAAA